MHAESEGARTHGSRHDFLRRADRCGCGRFPRRFRIQRAGDSPSGDPPTARVHGRCGMNCSNSIDAAVLADYWLATLPDAEEEAVEEHLLECDRCGQRLREVIALAEGLGKLAREGSLRMVISDAFINRAAEAGLRVRQYAVPAGGSVECTVTAEDNFLIGRLALNVSGATRVDLCMCDERGVEQLRLQDIPVHSGATSVIYQ